MLKKITLTISHGFHASFYSFVINGEVPPLKILSKNAAIWQDREKLLYSPTVQQVEDALITGGVDGVRRFAEPMGGTVKIHDHLPVQSLSAVATEVIDK